MGKPAQQMEEIYQQTHRNQPETSGHIALASDPSPRPTEDELMIVSFVGYVFDLTAEHLPHPEQIIRRAKSWLRLLGPHFFRPETHYVVEIVCRLRGDRRDAIKADEVLRVAEKVYGNPVSMWHLPGAPQVWSVKENDWIPLQTALDRLWQVHPAYSKENSLSEDLKFFQLHRSDLLKMIYGGEV
jgi:hypothetical protein